MDLPGKLIAVIGDEDTVTGFILAGTGHRTTAGENFLVVKSDTDVDVIEKAFDELTTRPDIGILLLNQHVANSIRHKLRDYAQTIPTILEIPSKVGKVHIVCLSHFIDPTLYLLHTLSFHSHRIQDLTHPFLDE